MISDLIDSVVGNMTHTNAAFAGRFDIHVVESHPASHNYLAGPHFFKDGVRQFDFMIENDRIGVGYLSMKLL